MESINLSPIGTTPNAPEEPEIQRLRDAYGALESTVGALVTYLGDLRGLAAPLVAVINDIVEPAVDDVVLSAYGRRQEAEQVARQAEEARTLQQQVDVLQDQADAAASRPAQTRKMLLRLRTVFADASIGPAVDAMTVALQHLGLDDGLSVSDSSPVGAALRSAEALEEFMG